MVQCSNKAIRGLPVHIQGILDKYERRKDSVVKETLSKVDRVDERVGSRRTSKTSGAIPGSLVFLI